MRLSLLASFAVFFSCAPVGSAVAQSCSTLHTHATAMAPTAPTLVHAKQAPATTLFTDRSLDVREVVRTEKRSTTSFLVATQQGQSAVIATVGGMDRNGLRHARWYLPPDSVLQPGGDLVLSTMEHLYAFLFRQDPKDRFILGEVPAKAPVSVSSGISHGAALARVAALRNCAALALEAKGPSVPMWQIAEILLLPSKGADGLLVSAQVRDSAKKPIPGQLTFGRGDHLACYADTGEGGVGACTLFDAHGHDVHEKEDAETTVTFSGLVEPGRIVPPTTSVFGRSKAGKKAGRAH